MKVMIVRITADMPVENRTARSAPFDRGKLAFALLLGRVAVAAVLMLADHLPLALGLHEVIDFLGVVEIVVRGVHNGRGDGEVRMLGAVQAVDRQGRGVPVLRDRTVS